VPQGREGKGTRPTTDRVREALFNVLAADVEFPGIAVLDLYAGSGALGLEALSRGASSSLFVESDRRAAAVITANVEILGVAGAVVRCAPVAAVLAGGAARQAGLVFADPPYALADAAVSQVLSLLAGQGWLAPGALVIVERATRSGPVSWPDGFVPDRTRRYGEATFWYGLGPKTPRSPANPHNDQASP